MKPKLESYKRMGALASSMEFSVYCIMRDFHEGRRNDRILTGEIVAIIASPLEEGVIDVGKVNKAKLEEDMIKIGLETLVLADGLREGREVGVNLTEAAARMMRVPTRYKLGG